MGSAKHLTDGDLWTSGPGCSDGEPYTSVHSEVATAAAAAAVAIVPRLA